MFFIKKILQGLSNMINEGINRSLITSMQWIDEITFDFWDNYIIKGFLSFSMWINWVVFILAFAFSLFDAAEEAGSMKQIDWLAVCMNFIKGALFVSMYSYLAIGIMQVSNIVTTSLNLRITLFNSADSSMLEDTLKICKSLIMKQVVSIILLVTIISFLAISLKRYGTMLIQIFSSAFYIPDIVRGETTKLGDWLRQTIAIAFTYTFQYVLFYIGFIIYLNNNSIVDVLLAMGLWMSMGGVSQVLSKYGFSSGIKGGSTMASMASQGLQLLTKR